MSDTSAFLGGAAFAGLAALILLKGGISVGTPGMPQSVPSLQPVPVPSASPLAQLPPSPSPAVPNLDVEKQKFEIEHLKAQLEQEKARAEQMKGQIQSQQSLIDSLTKNNANAAAVAARQAQMVASAEQQPNSSLLTGLLWALGGMILTFGGGVALVGMFVLFSRQQRPTRTVEVIHPEDYPLTYMPARRRPQMLPPRRAIRRANPMDEE